MIKIKDVELSSPFILAPMAGVTNSAFRTICRECSKDSLSLVHTEMISDKGILYKNKKTLDMLNFEEHEHPISVQLFGSEKESLLSAAKFVEENYDFDLIDINMGCPVNKVIKAGAGSALLKDINKIDEILDCLTKNLKTSITIKIRAGWDLNEINCDKVAVVAEKRGVSALTIHSRVRSQLYRGSVNLAYVKKIKEASNIFLIASGDIKTIDDVFAYQALGCNCFMIGRSALGNPWIFDKLNKELNHKEFIEPSKKEVIDTLLKHARLLIASNGEKNAMVEMRSHAVWYFKRFKDAKSYRLRLVKISTYQDLYDICMEYLNENIN